MGPATKLLGLQLAGGVALLPYAGRRGSAATAAQQQPKRRRLGLAPGAELGFHARQAAEKARAATAREGHTQGPAGCSPLGAGAGNGSPASLTGRAAVVGARGEAEAAAAAARRGSNGPHDWQQSRETSAGGRRRATAVVGRGARSFTAPHAESPASPPAPALAVDWTRRRITTAATLATPLSHWLRHSPPSPQAVSPR